MPTYRVVATPEDAEAVLEYFNGFHDGFIKQLTLLSHDYFEDRGAQVCSGRLDLELTIAHYNYRNGEPPADQLVHARFAHVRHLQADVPGNAAEWSIVNVYFERGTHKAAWTEGRRFYARFLQSRLDKDRWVHYPALRFSFQEAEFRELPAS
jgi:hypothetical protein